MRKNLNCLKVPEAIKVYEYKSGKKMYTYMNTNTKILLDYFAGFHFARTVNFLRRLPMMDISGRCKQIKFSAE